jgi:hypothetical protein
MSRKRHEQVFEFEPELAQVDVGSYRIGYSFMKTVQITLDENLVKAVDSAARKLGTTRSGFTREALRSALKEVRIKELESKHREGYKT